LRLLDTSWRAANFLGAAQIDLRDNVLKERLHLGEGTTTAPFMLLAMNGVDRFHVLIQAVRAASPINRAVAAKAEAIVARYERKLADDRSYLEAHGVGPPEITDWSWSDGEG
jgi:xylulose-5-phosphate/fructose-6-phosphate phosphoketolase